jgi:hypothetical protein
MATLSRFFAWRGAPVNVKADTLTRWHRNGFRLFWRWKSKPMGRPPLPKDLRRLIRETAVENVSWGEERIADELHLKLGIRVSPRTVGKYLDRGNPRRAPSEHHRGRPHSSLGPGIPESSQGSVPASGHRHKLAAGCGVATRSVLGGLHHEYFLVKEAE